MTNKSEAFASMHIPGNPLILYNIWDAGSTVAVAKAGAKAIATGSYGVAGAHGIGDGEKLPLDIAIATLTEVLAVTDLPVTIDMEAGYGIKAAAATGLFVNARADLFILTPPAEHDAAKVDMMIERAKAYADAGARSLFAPFLQDAALIERLCSRSPLPVNILMRVGCPDHKALAGLGVARISHGHGPWAAAMDWLQAEAEIALNGL
jgi:2-methylisocitrate lyase-like PEP mutase family enzyme